MEFLKKFETYLLQTDRSSSVEFYCGDVSKFAHWFIHRHGEFNPSAITSLDLVDYRSYLQLYGGRRTKSHPIGQPAAPATVNRALVSLSLFCQWAFSVDILLINPAQGIKSIQTEELAPYWLTRQQQAAFMRAVMASQVLRDLAICGLMLHAGLRVGEVCSLYQRDITIRERSGLITVRCGKGNKQRYVPLNATIRRFLSEYLNTLPQEQEVLFASCRTAHFSERAVQHLVARYAYRAKLNHVSPHKLRHSFCKNLIDAGVSLDKVALLAGHTSLEVTRRYVIPSEQDLQEAVEHLAWE
jgi:integrase/recombinase XerC